jgi:hypothetical protein
MKEIDAILMGVAFTVGGAIAVGIIYFCKNQVFVKTNDLDVVNNIDEMNVTYNEIYRKMEEP